MKHKNSLLLFGALFLGVQLGIVFTHRYFKKKCQADAQEEIDSVKKAFAKEQETRRCAEEPADTTPEEASSHAKPPEDLLLQYQGKEDNGPYVISPTVFGTIPDYWTISLTYFSDGVLADEDDQKIDNITEIVGADFASHFGEFEKDAVYIRNEAYAVDYEILRDERKYSEVLLAGPPRF